MLSDDVGLPRGHRKSTSDSTSRCSNSIWIHRPYAILMLLNDQQVAKESVCGRWIYGWTSDMWSWLWCKANYIDIALVIAMITIAYLYGTFRRRHNIMRSCRRWGSLSIPNLHDALSELCFQLFVTIRDTNISSLRSVSSLQYFSLKKLYYKKWSRHTNFVDFPRKNS